MSGGSWEYIYSKVDDAADQLVESKLPIRRAFGKHLKLVATALHDIEWVDSGDYSKGGEAKSIEAALGSNATLLGIMEELVAEAKRVQGELETVINHIERPPTP